MRFQTIVLFATLVSLPLHVIVPESSYAQSQPAPAIQQSAAPSAQPPTRSQAQDAPLKNAKPAKVWTNEEIDTLRNNHGVSVVGKRTPRNVSATANAYSVEKDPVWYRRQIKPLRTEIAKLDGQIKKTRAFLNGEKVNDPPASYDAYFDLPGNPQDQLKQMEAKRQTDEAKMEDLLDRARHNGIEPGALR